MIAPAIWYLFLSAIEYNMEFYGSYDAAISALRDNTTERERINLISFFEKASKTSGNDCETLTLEGTKEKLYFDTGEQTCQEYYAFLHKYFKEI